MNFVTYKELVSDIHAWIDARPDWYEYRGVVGIPNSGMVPAHIIASRCGLPVVDLESYLNTGGRFRPSRHLSREMIPNPTKGKVLVIDDSIYAGMTMKWAEGELRSHAAMQGMEYELAAIYSSMISIPYSYFRVIDSPRMFEWNWLHNTTLTDCLVDLDGLICEDPRERIGEDDYASWIPRAKPRHLPKVRLGVIVSARLEKYQEPTEQWLRDHSIVFHELFLIDSTAEERESRNLYVEHKARCYQNSQAHIFIESDHGQAKQISRRTKRPVLCMTDPITIYSE